jgi:hypothetical protein
MGRTLNRCALRRKSNRVQCFAVRVLSCETVLPCGPRSSAGRQNRRRIVIKFERPCRLSRPAPEFRFSLQIIAILDVNQFMKNRWQMVNDALTYSCRQFAVVMRDHGNSEWFQAGTYK